MSEGSPQVSGEEYAEWLTRVFGRSVDPVYFQTLTFAPLPYELFRSTAGPSVTRVNRAGSWLSWYMTRAIPTATYFSVVEAGSLNGRRHLHSLISAPESSIRAAQRWHETRHGFGALEKVDSVGGVSGYVTKYVTKSVDPVWFAGGPLWRQ